MATGIFSSHFVRAKSLFELLKLGTSGLLCALCLGGCLSLEANECFGSDCASDDHGAGAISSELSCALPAELGEPGDAGLSMTVQVAPTKTLVAGKAVSVELEAELVISETLGRALLALGASQIEFDSATVELEVVGGTESPILLEAGSFSVELDRDEDDELDDEALSVKLPFDAVSVTSDGGPFVVFKVAHIDLPIANAPRLGALPLSDRPEGAVECGLSSSELAIPVGGGVCSLDAPSETELCGGSCEPPAPADVHGTVECELEFGLGLSRTYLSIRIAPSATFTPETGVEVSLKLDKVVPKSLGQIFIDVHETDQVHLDGIVVDVSVDGAPEKISIRAGETSFDVDQDDDGVAEDVWEEIHGGTVVLTPECTDSLEFAFSHFEMGFHDVPLLGDLFLTEDPSNSDLNCTLRSEPVTFDVLNP